MPRAQSPEVTALSPFHTHHSWTYPSGGLAPTAIALAESHTCVTRPAQRAGAADRVASDTRPATKPRTFSAATALAGDYYRKQNFTLCFEWSHPCLQLAANFAWMRSIVVVSWTDRRHQQCCHRASLTRLGHTVKIMACSRPSAFQASKHAGEVQYTWVPGCRWSMPALAHQHLSLMAQCERTETPSAQKDTISLLGERGCE